MNDHVYSILLFVSFRPRYQAEFEYIASGLLAYPKISWYNFFTIQVFVRAHFDYDPEKDKMIPCQDAGLSFKNGDVLQIVEQDDPNWWQVSILSLPVKKIPVSLSDLLAKHKK